MANRIQKGAAEIEYQPLAGPPVVHLLAVPLLVSEAAGFKATQRRKLWTGWNEDQTVRETFKLGTQVDEITGTVRFEDQPRELRELIRAGLEDDVAMTYRPYGPTGVEFPCKLVGHPGAQPGEIVLVPDRRGFKEWKATIILRRVDGGTFDELLDGVADS